MTDSQEPDYSFWLGLPLLTLEEAALCYCGIKPTRELQAKLRQSLGNEPDSAEEALYAIASRAVKAGELKAEPDGANLCVEPGTFDEWFDLTRDTGRFYEIPILDDLDVPDAIAQWWSSSCYEAPPLPRRMSQSMLEVWAEKAVWRLAEAVIILVGIRDPVRHLGFSELFDDDGTYFGPEEALYDAALRAIKAKQLEATEDNDSYWVEPGKFVGWFRSSSVSYIPNCLRDVVEALDVVAGRAESQRPVAAREEAKDAARVSEDDEKDSADHREEHKKAAPGNCLTGTAAALPGSEKRTSGLRQYNEGVKRDNERRDPKLVKAWLRKMKEKPRCYRTEACRRVAEEELGRRNSYKIVKRAVINAGKWEMDT